MCIYQSVRPVGTMVRVLANDLGNLGSIPSRVIRKIKKMVLDASLLNTQYYKIQVKGKWTNPEKEVVIYPIPQCSSYWKGSLQVVLAYCWPTYLYIIVKIHDKHVNTSSPKDRVCATQSCELSCFILFYCWNSMILLGILVYRALYFTNLVWFLL